LNKGINQYSDTDYANGNGKKVDFSFQVFASGTRFNRAFAVSKSKYESSSALGSRGVAGSYDFSGFKSGASVVRVVDVAANDSAGRWSSPRRVSLFSSDNSKRELGYKVLSSKPTNMHSLEWVMNFNSLTAVHDFGLNHDYPQDCTNTDGVYCCDNSSLDVVNRDVRNSGENANQGGNCQIDPITAGSVNVRVSHVGQTIADRNKVSPFSATKEGN